LIAAPLPSLWHSLGRLLLQSAPLSPVVGESQLDSIHFCIHLWWLPLSFTAFYFWDRLLFICGTIDVWGYLSMTVVCFVMIVTLDLTTVDNLDVKMMTELWPLIRKFLKFLNLISSIGELFPQQLPTLHSREQPSAFKPFHSYCISCFVNWFFQRLRRC
jgi:hypothetical protein